MNEDKYADEMLTDDELDVVTGGTLEEYGNLQNILPKVKRWNVIEHRYQPSYMNLGEMQEWLKANLNIDAKIDLFFENNSYNREGQSLTHEQVVGEIKQFLDQN